MNQMQPYSSKFIPGSPPPPLKHFIDEEICLNEL